MTSRTPPSFFLSTPHECSYMPDRTATTLLVDPRAHVSNSEYSALINHGFRRSGTLVYRPHCRDCQACIPMRVEVAHFSPRRSQRRTWRRNQDVVVEERHPAFTDEYFTLYQQYQATRHGGGSMDDPDPDKFRDFLVETQVDTVFFDMRVDGELIGVAVADKLDDSLSAIYSFFLPTLEKRSLGVYAVLWEIEYARRLGLKWLYLGYWINECRKMSYKKEYRPAQVLINGEWQHLDESIFDSIGSAEPAT